MQVKVKLDMKAGIDGWVKPRGGILDDSITLIDMLKYAEIWTNGLKLRGFSVRIDSQARRLTAGGANVQIQLNSDDHSRGTGTTIANVTVEKAVDDAGGFEIDERKAHERVVLDLVKDGLKRSLADGREYRVTLSAPI